MNQTEKLRAIQHIRPGAEFVLRDNKIEWFDNKQTQPTEAEIEAGWIAYQAKVEADKEEAQAKRQAALDKLAALGLNTDDLKALGLS
jgi:uncharacterized lipoprotein YddW (UPF0748 family)